MATRREFLLRGVTLVTGVTLLGPRAVLAEDCPATADNIEGPFYRPNAPFQNKLVGAEAAGERLVVSGRVLDPDCRPVEGAIVDVWQASPGGRYDLEDPNLKKDEFRLRGRMKTDAEGRYEFETVLPGAYEIGPKRYRPKHIHYKVSADGLVPLTTQLYFKGDPYLAKDPWAKDSLAIELKKDGPVLRGVFDVVLACPAKSGYGGFGE